MTDERIKAFIEEAKAAGDWFGAAVGLKALGHRMDRFGNIGGDVTLTGRESDRLRDVAGTKPKARAIIEARLRAGEQE